MKYVCEIRNGYQLHEIWCWILTFQTAILVAYRQEVIFFLGIPRRNPEWPQIFLFLAYRQGCWALAYREDSQIAILRNFFSFFDSGESELHFSYGFHPRSQFLTYYQLEITTIVKSTWISSTMTMMTNSSNVILTGLQRAPAECISGMHARCCGKQNTYVDDFQS